MYRRGDWKIVRENKEPWELYDMVNDRTEVKNLAQAHPEKLNELVALYEAYMSNLKNELAS